MIYLSKGPSKGGGRCRFGPYVDPPRLWAVCVWMCVWVFVEEGGVCVLFLSVFFF